MKIATMGLLEASILGAIVSLCSACGVASNTRPVPLKQPAAERQDQGQDKGKQPQVSDPNAKQSTLETLETCKAKGKILNAETGACLDAPEEEKDNVVDKKPSDPDLVKDKEPAGEQPATAANCPNLQAASVANLLGCLRQEIKMIETWLTENKISNGDIQMSIAELNKNVDNAEALDFQTGSSEYERAQFCLAVGFSRVDLSMLNSDAQHAGADLKELMTVKERDFLTILSELVKRGDCEEPAPTTTTSPF